MAITLTATEIVNTSGLGGSQTNVQTIQLNNGGYVVAWNTDVGGQQDILFQRYDAAGNAIGGPTLANSTTAGNQVLSDIVANGNGTFTLAWMSGGTTVTTRSFNDGTSAATSGEVNSVVTGTLATGVQLIATANGQYKVVTTSNNGGNTNIDQATYNTAGVTVSAIANINNAITGNVSINQLVDGNSGDQFALLSNGSIFSTANSQTVAALVADGRDIIKLENGTHVLIGELAASATGMLAAFTGTGTAIGSAAYSLGSSVSTGTLNGSLGTTPHVYDKVVLNLGDGRILSLWVANTGETIPSSPAPDGIYASVYNTHTGQLENFTPAIVADFGAGVGNAAALTAINIGADILADGRVAVSWNELNGLTGQDVFTRILDARVAPVTVDGVQFSGAFVGTGFAGDTLNYGTTAGAVKVDLADASLNTGDAAGDAPTGFESVTGGAFNDELYGTSGANVLNGGGGDDKLFGRDGNDTLTGGAGNNLLHGGTGDDSLTGGSGVDEIHGGLGNDKADAGSGDDAVVTGDGNDTILGGDGNDRAYAQAGDDTVDGGTGNDFVAGGAGDDIILGGTGADTLNGGDGNDTIDGGTGNDTIAGGAGTNLIDGGSNTDTVSYANLISVVGTSGFYIDLDGSADPVGNMDGFSTDDDLITNVENIIGSEGADYLGGNGIANTLRGGGGNDFLFGRGGNDRLIGGAGNDTFVFADSTNSGGTDKIADYTLGSDKIEIVSDNFGGINSGNIAASLVTGATPTPTSTAPVFLFDNAGAGIGTLSFDADGTGAGAAMVIATLTFTSAGGAAAFGAADFVFV